MARTKKSDAELVAEKRGRALVDVPAHNLKSGEFYTLESSIADSLELHGEFDTNAVEVK